MPEILALITPVAPASPATSTYAVWSLYLGRGEGRILLVAEDNNHVRTTCLWADEVGNPVATTLMAALNRANLTNTSLQKRILAQAVADGKLPAGSVTGTPD